MYIYQVERDLLKRVISRYADHINGKVLEVGSGPVKRYGDLFKNAKQYITLDINPEFQPDIIGSAESIPVTNYSFDGLVCTQVLGDILHPERAIKEFYRVLKLQGVVLLTEGFMNELHDEPQDFWRFTPYGLHTLFEKNNFEILAVEGLGGIFSVTTQMFTRYLINSLHLYNHKILGRIFSKFFFIIGKLAILLDIICKNNTNKKFAINFIIIARKKNI